MSGRTLGILSVVVAVLAIVVALDRPRRSEERSDRVLPGLVASAVTRVVTAATQKGSIRARAS